MSTNPKLISSSKTDAVKENTAQNSRSEQGTQYDQYRIDQVGKEVEGKMELSPSSGYQEYSIKTLQGEQFYIKRTRSIDDVFSFFCSALWTSKEFSRIYHDIYKVRYLGCVFFKNGKFKKNHYEIQVKRFSYIDGKFEKIVDLKVSTKQLEKKKVKD